MAHYSMAAMQEDLPAIIDKALAGEQVVVTREGKPVLELKLVQPARHDRAAAWASLEEWQRARARMMNPSIPYERFYEWLYEEESN